MFPAYSGQSNKRLEPKQIEAADEPPAGVKWMTNKSFKPQIDVKHSPDASDNEQTRKHKKLKEKKRKKEKKDKKRKKRGGSDSSEVESRLSPKLTVPDLGLIDKDYLKFFASFTKTDEVKKARFFEDLPGLTYRNAFRLDKIGDRNNMSFNSVYTKFVSKYDEPKRGLHSQLLKDKNVSGRKVIRLQVSKLKKQRFFNLKLASEENIVKSMAQVNSTLSDKMLMYLEIKNELDQVKDPTIRRAEFMSHLQANPNDIQKWLEFIDTEISENSYQQLNNAFYERLVSIYDKAIQSNPENFRLKFELIKFKARLAETIDMPLETIEAEFLGLILLKKDSDSEAFQVWTELLSFLITNSSTFLTFEKIRKYFQKCFKFFLDDNSKNSKNSKKQFKKPIAFYAGLLQILDKYGRFLKVSGYTEKAVSIYQACLDLNLCQCGDQVSPEYANADFKSKKLLLELYWDLSLPKFGEKFSNGWLNCLSSRDSLFEKLDAEEQPTRYDDFLDGVEDMCLARKDVRIEFRWLILENLRAVLHWYPFYPSAIAGETADDCVDMDRLVSFDEDIGFTLFDIDSTSSGPEAVECLKFKMLCQFFKLLDIFDWNEECLAQHQTGQEEDPGFVQYISNSLSFFEDDMSLETQNFLVNSIETMLGIGQRESFKLLTDQEKHDLLATLALSNKNLIDFLRNVFEQSLNAFKSLKFRTNLTILKWRFELNLIDILQRRKKDLDLCGLLQIKKYAPYFCPKTLKETLLAQVKADLSLEKNRSNFELWRQYGILKLILNQPRFNDTRPQGPTSIKETKKIFETLLSTSSSAACQTIEHCIDIYSLSVDYCLIEMGIFCRQFDVSTTSLNVFETRAELATVQFQSGGLFDVGIKSESRRKEINELKSVKSRHSELLAKNCLNRGAEFQQGKSKSTFKIGISESTRVLLLKRDFQNEYEKLKSKCKPELQTSEVDYLDSKKFFFYHQVYSLFLLCIDETDILFQLNDNLLTPTSSEINPFQSDLLEFYLNILNHLHYNENKITRQTLKLKIYKITTCFNSQLRPSKSFLRLIQTSFIRLKLDSSALFCSQLIESSDTDLILERLGTRIPAISTSLYLTLIYTHIYKLNKVLELTGSVKTDFKDTYSTNLGIHYKIRRLFESALKHQPHSLQLWLFYLKFEIMYANCSKERIVYIYYQSIRSLPYCKRLYTLAVENLPDKYNEIMQLLYDKEMRVYLPIQELNILLEPIKRLDELEEEEEEEEEEETDEDMEVDKKSGSGKVTDKSSDDSSGEKGEEDDIENSLESFDDDLSISSVEDLKDIDY